MTVQVETSNEDVREVFNGLVTEFSGVLPRAVVSKPYSTHIKIWTDRSCPMHWPRCCTTLPGIGW